MSENTNTVTEVTGQIDLIDGSVVEESAVTLTEIVSEIAKEIFKGEATVTPYKIAVIINKVFEATMTEKRIPTQMMYTYDKNGMIVKGKKAVKAYTQTEVETFVNKYTAKHVNI